MIDWQPNADKMPGSTGVLGVFSLFTATAVYSGGQARKMPARLDQVLFSENGPLPGFRFPAMHLFIETAAQLLRTDARYM